MSNYRPRPAEVKDCKHCGISFETNHKRTIYCGEPCRRLAFYDRHRHDQDKPNKLAKGNLDFSVRNVATIATGVLVADATKAGLNAVLDIQPTNTQLLKEINALRKQSEGLQRSFLMMIDFINAQMKIDEMGGYSQLRQFMQVEFDKRKQQQVTALSKVR